jgi:hypothetical protein
MEKGEEKMLSYAKNHTTKPDNEDFAVVFFLPY